MKRSLKLSWLMSTACPALILLIASQSHGGPLPQEGTPAAGAKGRPVSLNQGWNDKQRQKFRFTSQGSELVPYDWFMALEQKDGTELIRSDANLGGELGFVLDTPGPDNPGGLPLGFARVTDKKTGVVWLGMSCAACHANQIDTGTASLRIDGGPTLANTYGFFGQVAYALQATGQEDAKFDRFARKVLGQGYNPASASALRQAVSDLAADRVQRQRQNDPPHPYGHGRSDAFGQIFNQVLVQDLTQLARDLNWPEAEIKMISSRNTHPADAPVSYPFLWDTPHYDLVQWPGILPNSGPFGLARDAGELLGVFGQVELKPNLGLGGYPSSIQVEAMGELQKLLRELVSPLWPEEYLPPLDRAKVASGQLIYQQQCAQCHAVIDRTDSKRRLFAVMTPLVTPGNDPDSAENLGTDSTEVDNALSRIAWTGPLKGNRLFGELGQKFGTWVPANDMLKHVTIGILLAHKLEDAEAVIREYTHLESTPTFDPRSYKARSLNGIWATAPYLHNGSVPNLWELLKPPAQRIQKFQVGSRRLDPVNVGFDITSGPSLLDTRLRGNSNAGHAYGTDLTDEQKWALVEYLKSL